jgi:hypothetical protein
MTLAVMAARAARNGVNFLNDSFATIATRQIEIDVGPAFAALAQKTFEKQFMLHRINRGDPKTKTNCTVRTRFPDLAP